MLTVEEIDLPPAIQSRLKENAAFTDSFWEFTKEHLAGFRQPVAAVAAVIGPILIAFTYIVSDFFTMVEVATTFGLTTLLFLLGAWYTNRQAIRASFVRQVETRRQAKADLKAGRGAQVVLTLKEQPLFYEHDHGVVALAAVSEDKSVYFEIEDTEEDPRWFLYLNGDMHRSNWQWLRLMGTGTVTQFQVDGTRMTSIGQPPYLNAPDAWEAISLALGEPTDGDIIDLPLKEAAQTIARLL